MAGITGLTAREIVAPLMTARPLLVPVAVLLTVLLTATPATAQTDYFNLDKNRPTRVEDAYSTKHYAFEFKAVPLALTGEPGGMTAYRPEVELKYGLLPGFDIEAGIGVPLAPLSEDIEAGHAEIDASAMLNLTVETRFLPALGLRASTHYVPALDDPLSFEFKGMATRTLVRFVRLHLNGAIGLAEGRHEDWWAGAAFDYTMPFRSLLLVASGYAAQMNENHFGTAADDLRWHTELGTRYQISPTLTVDAGIGRSWSGPGGDEWSLALGLTHEFGVRALIPTRRR